MSGEEPPTKSHQKLRPPNILSTLEVCPQSRVPPDVGTILQHERCQQNPVLLRTANSTEDLLSLSYPTLRNAGGTLSTEARRSHPPKLLHHRHPTSTILRITTLEPSK